MPAILGLPNAAIMRRTAERAKARRDKNQPQRAMNADAYAADRLKKDWAQRICEEAVMGRCRADLSLGGELSEQFREEVVEAATALLESKGYRVMLQSPISTHSSTGGRVSRWWLRVEW